MTNIFSRLKLKKASVAHVSGRGDKAASTSTGRLSQNDAVQRPLQTKATDISNVSETPGTLSTGQNLTSELSLSSQISPPSAGECGDVENTKTIATESDAEANENTSPQLSQWDDTGATSIAATADETTKLVPIAEIWDEAYEELSEKETDLIVKYEAQITITLGLTEGALNGRAQRRDQMKAAIDKRIEEIQKGEWKMGFNGRQLAVKDLVKSVASIVDWAKNYVGTALATSPPASMAWGGVCLLLPLVLNPSAQEASRLKGLEEISGITSQCSIRESLYHRRYESHEADADLGDLRDLHVIYRNSLKDLYMAILNFQATAFLFLLSRTSSRTTKDMVKWNDWDDMLATVKAEELRFKSIEEQWRDKKYDEDLELQKRQHEESVGGMKAIQDEVSRVAKAILQAHQNTERSKLLEWMRDGVDSSGSYKMFWERRVYNGSSETGNWLVNENAQFKQWENDPNSLLWMHGQAGIGKSVLSSSVIHHLQASYNEDPHIAIAYFYFDFNDPKKQNKTSMIRSIIAQLCYQMPDTIQPLQNLSRHQASGSQPLLEEFENTLKEAITDFTGVYLVIDGLDECTNAGDGSEGRGLLQLIKKIHSWAARNLHVLLTSRQEKHIDDWFRRSFEEPEDMILDLRNRSEQVNKDIETFIDQRIESDSNEFPNWTPEIKAKIKTKLIEKAQQSFQYVAMQLIPLITARSENDVDEALEALPAGLDSTYNQVLQRVSKRDQKKVMNALSWIAFSMHPITVRKLSEAMIINVPDDSRLHTLIEDPSLAFDTRNRFSDPEEVLHLLSGLVVVQDRPYHKRSVIRFSHFSVKEYLVSDRIREGPASAFSISEKESHMLISKSCLLYYLHVCKVMETKNVSGWEGVKGFHLWKYTYSTGFLEIEAMPREDWTQSLEDLIISVFTAQSFPFQTLVKIQNPEPLAIRKSAYYNYNDLEETLEETLCDPTPPLSYTSYCGYPKITSLLLDKKVGGVNDIGGLFGTALNAACASSWNRETTVKLLLDAKADPFLGNKFTTVRYQSRYAFLEILGKEIVQNCS